jgi:hypothetical protein
MPGFLSDDEAEKIGLAEQPDPNRVLSDDEANSIGFRDVKVNPNEGRFGQSLLNGLTFGLRPRIQATIESGAISGPDYEKAKAEQFAKDDAYAAANPATALAGEVVGSIPTMFVPGLGAGRLAAAATRLGARPALSGAARAKRLLGVGAEVGSIGHEAGMLGAKTAALAGGLGSREDSLAGRLEDAAISAPIGYGAGRVGDWGGRKLVGLAEEVRDAVRVGGNAEMGALTGLKRGIEQDGTSIPQLREAVLPDMGRTQVVIGGREAALTAYGDAVTGGASPAAAQAAAAQAYTAHARAQNSALSDSTLAKHVGQIVRGYEAKNPIPLAIDETARVAGGRGQNLQWTRRAAQASPSEGKEAVFDAVTGRQEELVDKVRGRVANTLGDENFLEAKNALVSKNRANEDALYGIARQHETPFDISSALEEVNRTHPFRGGDARKIMEEAMSIMRGDPLPDGSYERHTLDSYIQSRRQLNELIGKSMDVNQVTGAKSPTTATSALMDLKKKMDAIVGTSNPKWRWANDIAADGRSEASMMDDARRMKLTDTDKHTAQVLRRVSTLRSDINSLRTSINSKKNPLPPGDKMEAQAALNLKESQLEAHQMGFARVIHDALSGLGDTHDASKLFLKGGKGAQSGVRKVVDVMMGEDAPAFMDLIKRAQIASTTYKNQFNSQTTPLRETIDEAKQSNKMAGAVKGLSYLLNPRQMATDASEAIANRLYADRNTALLKRYATTTDKPADFLRLLSEIEGFGLNRGRAFTSEGVNAYSVPGVASGAFASEDARNKARRY